MTRVVRLAGALALMLCVAAPAGAASTPNDPGFAQQWGLKKIQVVEAWAGARGTGIVVAIVDTGVDSRHPDLRGRVLPGKDFVDGDNDASDVRGHGTHVAGTVAAVTGNGFGVASVAPGSKILPVRVLGSNGEGDPGDVADGIRWAVQRGAKVVNLSLAQDQALPIDGPSLLGDTRVDEAIKDAAKAGAVVVVAAGNDDSGGHSETSYSSTTPGVIVVGASTTSDARAAYSNYGSGLDILAPGGGSSTDPKACSEGNWIVSTWWNPKSKRSDYGGGCGTSMAVAHVSGIAALLLSKGYSSAGAVMRMEQTARDLGTPGRDDDSGFGRVDALHAVAPLSRPKPSPKPSTTSQGSITTFSPKPSPTPTASGANNKLEAVSPTRTGPLGKSRSLPITLAALVLLLVTAGHGATARSVFAKR